MSLGEGRTDPVTAKLRAMAHPVRLRILSLLTGAPMTAADVARELNLTHANASYHLRQLHAAGAIETAGEERIRGGVAKRYRYHYERDLRSLPADLPVEAHLSQRRAMYAALAAELGRRAQHLRYGPGRQHLTDADLWVDPEVFAEVKTAVESASQKLHRAARPPRTEGTIRVNATLALFELEPDA